MSSFNYYAEIFLVSVVKKKKKKKIKQFLFSDTVKCSKEESWLW